GYRGVQLASTVDSYWALVHGSHVDPSAVFTEIPENASLCNYKTVADYYKKTRTKPSDKEIATLESLHSQWMARRTMVENRWTAVTGQTLDLTQRQRVGDIIEHKATIPLRPAWSRELYSLEARQRR